MQLITDPEILNQLGWQEFIDSHPQGTVFQSPVMFELWGGSQFMEPAVVGMTDDSGELAGILLGVIIRESKGIKGYFSSRTVVYGGPVIRSAVSGQQSAVGGLDCHREEERRAIPHDYQALKDLLSAFIDLVKSRSIFIQFRNFYDMMELTDTFESEGFRYYERLNLLVDTTSLEVVKKNMSEARWRQIRKGLASGAEIINATCEKEVNDFYDLLKDLYRRKVKKPLPDRSFFLKFFHLTQKNEGGIIKLVRYNGQIIGGILCPITPEKVIYEWYVCGLDHEYRFVFPSVLATWAAIEYATKNKISRFDFMGVGIPSRPYGVREFKSRFGGDMVNYGRFARVNNRFLLNIAEIGYNIISGLKKL